MGTQGIPPKTTARRNPASLRKIRIRATRKTRGKRRTETRGAAKKSAEPDDSFAEIKKLPPEKMRAELEKFLYTSDGMRKYIEESGIRYDSPLSCPPDADIERDENNGENKADSASARRGGDRRPKITFEHVRTVEPKEP